MQSFPYRLGLHEIADGVFAFLQPGGTWGLSNAGLLVSDNTSLLVDTLFDEIHTRRMLDEMRRVTVAARSIATVVNTHANGDHCWGNSLVRGARIVAAQRCAEEMKELPPKKMAMLMRSARLVTALGPVSRVLGAACAKMGLGVAADFVQAAPYLHEAFGRFDFRGIDLVLPTETFNGRLELEVAGRRVELIEVGPAHTRGDIIVHIPDAGVVFSGDVVFQGVHPLVWEGPISGWIRACEQIVALAPTVVVPGHGPISDAGAVCRLADYLRAVRAHAETAYNAGASEEEAAGSCVLPGFDDWAESERLVVNIRAAYREFRGAKRQNDAIPAFAAMARVHGARRQGRNAS